MKQNLKKNVKYVESNQQLITLQEKNSKIGINQNLSSKYLEKINSILRGEWNNPDKNERNAIINGISLINKKTCKNY